MSRYAIIALVFVACVVAQANSYPYGAKGRREVQGPMKTQYTQYQQPEPVVGQQAQPVVVAQQAQPVAAASAQQPFVAATKGGSQSFYAQEPLKAQYAQYQQQPEVLVAQQPQPVAVAPAQTVAVAQQAQPVAVASAQQPFVASTKGGSQSFYAQEPLKTKYAQYQQQQPEVVVAQQTQPAVVAHRQQYDAQQPFVASTKGGGQSLYAQEPLKTQYAQYQQQQPEVMVAQQTQPAVVAHRQQYDTQQPFVAAAKGQSFYAPEPLKTQYTQYQQQSVVAQPAQATVVAHRQQYEAQQPLVAATKGSQSFYTQEPAFKGQYQPAAQSSH